ncbi:ankyrin repeat-containing domain protein [Xylaria sp. FL0064]|nr:ankyrin repeat-containing domain protein [Xylaria sp. FL0064]
MAEQLPLEVLRLVANKLTAAGSFRAAMKLSSVSHAVYDAIYCSILPANRSVVLTENESEILDHYIKSDNTALVAMFLDSTGIDVNISYSEFNSILTCAADAGAPSVVEFLLKAGASIIGAERADRRPLYVAVDKGHYHVTKLLLENGAIATYGKLRHENFGSWNKENLLVHELISRARSVELAEALIPYCSDLNELDEFGLALLHRVCYGDYWRTKHMSTSEQRKILRVLISAGARTDLLGYGHCAHAQLQYRNGLPHLPVLEYTPLDYACTRAEPDLIRALLESGASMGETTLHGLLNEVYGWPTSTKLNKACESVKLLFDHGLSGPQAYFELDCAQMKSDSNELWTILIERGAKTGVFDAHRRDQYGQTSLAQLVSRQFGEVTNCYASWKPNLLRALVNAGSDPNTIDGRGLTPLHYATLHGDFDYVQLLIELGADPSQVINGATPTHYAFGKPFDCTGPVVQHVISSFLERLLEFWTTYYTRSIDRRDYRSFEETPLDLAHRAANQYRKPRLNLFLAVCRDPLLQQACVELVRNARHQTLSIMAILQPWADTVSDENGQTPRDIAKSDAVGLIGETEGNSLCFLELENDSNVREGAYFRGYGQRCELRYTAYGYLCYSGCPNCSALPRPLLDLATGYPRPISLTRCRVITEHDQSASLPISPDG